MLLYPAPALSALARLLRVNGHEVAATEDAVLARALAASGRFGLAVLAEPFAVLSDPDREPLSGELRAASPGLGVLVLIHGYPRAAIPDMMLRLTRAGISDWLVEPVAPARLLRAAAAVLARSVSACERSGPAEAGGEGA